MNSLRTTKEIFYNQRPNCFSRVNFKKSEKTDLLFRTESEVTEHIRSINSRLEKVSMARIRNWEFINYFLDVDWDKAGFISLHEYWEIEDDLYIGDSYLSRDRDTYKKGFEETKDFQWEWYGTILYVKTAIELALKWHRLCSGWYCSDKARRVWNSLISSKIANFNRFSSTECTFHMDNNKIEEYFL